MITINVKDIKDAIKEEEKLSYIRGLIKGNLLEEKDNNLPYQVLVEKVKLSHIKIYGYGKGLLEKDIEKAIEQMKKEEALKLTSIRRGDYLTLSEKAKSDYTKIGGTD